MEESRKLSFLATLGFALSLANTLQAQKLTPPKVLLPSSEATTKTAAINNCGNSGTAPRLFSKELQYPQALAADGTAPAPWYPAIGRYTRSGMEYVSGNGLRYLLVTDKCTYISEVRVGSAVVTPIFANGYQYVVEPSSTPPADPSRVNSILWIYFPEKFDGSLEVVQVTIGRVAGTRVVKFSVPVVHVQEVNATRVDAPITISRTELWNLFSKALYKRFNGAANSFYTTNKDGSRGRRLYDYDPNSFEMTVDPSGVGFEFKFKADVQAWCDPTVRAYGTFKLTAVFALGLGMQWQPGSPQASLTWPAGCAAVQFIQVVGELTDWIVYDPAQKYATDTVQTTLTDSITAALPTFTPSPPFDGTADLIDEVRIFLQIPTPSVQIAVPYNTFASGQAGTPFGGNEPLLLLASGIGMSDYVANLSPQTKLWSGPMGVPLAGAVTTWPNPETVQRSTPITYPGQPVANLLMRISGILGTTTFAYTNGCVIGAATVQPGVRQISWGVNDTAPDAARLRDYLAAGGYSVRVFFAKGFITSQSPCSSMSTHANLVGK